MQHNICESEDVLAVQHAGDYSYSPDPRTVPPMSSSMPLSSKDLRLAALSRATRFIVCNRRILTLLQECKASGPVLHDSGSIYILSAESGWRDKLLRGTLEVLLVETYLDHFDIVAHVDDRKAWPLLSAALFEFIADSYEEWIDRGRNLENIQTLIDILLQTSERPMHTLIDFGCGVGLSKHIGDSLGLHVIGFDPSAKMRQLAAMSGIEVWGPEELQYPAAHSVDGAFASYVFDLFPTSSQLASVWSAIRPGGVFVGNCHKGRGTKHVTEVLEAQGATRTAVHARVHFAHGVYIAFKKHD